MYNSEQLKQTVIEQNIKVHSKEASIYENLHLQLFNWYYAKKRKRDLKYILNILGQKPKINVLDLGCGTGCLTLELIRYSHQVQITAVDLSKEMLFELERKIPISFKEKISLNNSEAIRFLHDNDLKYDLIMTSAFLHHLIDLEEFIFEVIKNLKSGGILYIAYEPLKQNIDNKFKFCLHRIVRMLDVLVFNLYLKLSAIKIDSSYERDLADYQTTLGGVDPLEVASYLKDKGAIIKYDKFSARVYGILAFVADRIIKSENTFSIIFQKL